jgi:hypothetical protein
MRGRFPETSLRVGIEYESQPAHGCIELTLQSQTFAVRKRVSCVLLAWSATCGLHRITQRASIRSDTATQFSGLLIEGHRAMAIELHARGDD